uniref:DUF1735 domain-containing protein n=1 Tax=uncultured Draconibacterium sp. TaxID=1573823 RepID=UPI003216A9A5
MRKSYLLYTLLIVISLLTSCEKGLDTIETESTIYIPLSDLTNQTVLLGESTFKLGIYNAGINQVTSDITVNLKVDQTAFNELQQSNSEYDLLPETYYNIESTEVVIGSREVSQSLSIKLKGINESFTGKNYVLPISIESVSPEVSILEDKKTALLNFTRYRNAYECKYKANGSVTPSGNEKSNVKIDEEQPTISVSANSIQIKGAETNMQLILTVAGDQVTVSGAPGSEMYEIANTQGKTSTYTGSFDSVQQSNMGTFKLYYTYLKFGKQMNVEVELKSYL